MTSTEIALLTIVASTITGAIGVVVGNMMAIGRDRRKEYNELAWPVINGLDKELRDIRHPRLQTTRPEWEQLAAGLRPWHRAKFWAAVEQREEAATKLLLTPAGETIRGASEALTTANVQLLHYVRMK